MNRENAIRQKQKLRLGSKTFRSIFKSILMLLPVSIVIIVAAEVAFLHMMDRLAEDFESRTVSRVLNQVDLDFQQTYMVATRLKADETILSYVRKSERDYYSEWEVFDRLRAIISGYNNIEEIYLYFPGYEYVLSSLFQLAIGQFIAVSDVHCHRRTCLFIHFHGIHDAFCCCCHGTSDICANNQRRIVLINLQRWKKNRAVHAVIQQDISCHRPVQRRIL